MRHIITTMALALLLCSCTPEPMDSSTPEPPSDCALLAAELADVALNLPATRAATWAEVSAVWEAAIAYQECSE